MHILSGMFKSGSVRAITQKLQLEFLGPIIDPNSPSGSAWCFLCHWLSHNPKAQQIHSVLNTQHGFLFKCCSSGDLGQFYELVHSTCFQKASGLSQTSFRLHPTFTSVMRTQIKFPSGSVSMQIMFAWAMLQIRRVQLNLPSVSYKVLLCLSVQHPSVL